MNWKESENLVSQQNPVLELDLPSTPHWFECFCLVVLNWFVFPVVPLQTVQTILLVVTGFTICWMPHHIIVMWVEFGTYPLNDATFALRIVSHCLSYGNSCINPILYAFLSENFRKACRQVFSRHLLYAPPADGRVVRFHMDNFSTTHSSTNI